MITNIFKKELLFRREIILEPDKMTIIIPKELMEGFDVMVRDSAPRKGVIIRVLKFGNAFQAKYACVIADNDLIKTQAVLHAMVEKIDEVAMVAFYTHSIELKESDMSDNLTLIGFGRSEIKTISLSDTDIIISSTSTPKFFEIWQTWDERVKKYLPASAPVQTTAKKQEKPTQVSKGFLQEVWDAVFG